MIRNFIIKIIEEKVEGVREQLLRLSPRMRYIHRKLNVNIPRGRPKNLRGRVSKRNLMGTSLIRATH